MKMEKIAMFLKPIDDKGENKKIYVINSGAKIPINSNNKIDTLIPNFNYLIKNKDAHPRSFCYRR